MKAILTCAAALLSVGGAASAGMIEDFERETLGPTWSVGGNATIGIVADTANTGTKSARWTLTCGPGKDYGNEITLRFNENQDWSSATQITLAFDAGALGSAKVGSIRFSYAVDKTAEGGPKYSKVDGGAGVTTFGFDKVTGFQTRTLNLGSFTRDKVSQISFYIYGGDFDAGTYTFFIDDISVNTAPIPEPASIGMLGIAAAALLTSRFKTKR